ncbi:MAG: hypothetical protein ACYCS1_01145 [Gammaproteobacteria bacterium]
MSAFDFDSTREMRYLMAGLKDGSVSPVTCYEALCRASLFTVNRVRADEVVGPAQGGGLRNLQAVVMDLPPHGRHVALFLTHEEAQAYAQGLAGEHEVIGTLGGMLVAGLPQGVGIVVQPLPGEGGFRLSASGLERLKRDFGIALPPPQGESGTDLDQPVSGTLQ